MNKLVLELKRVMKEKGISREKASRFLDVSAMTIHRWFNSSNSPSISSLRIIEEGIARIRKAYPEIEKERPIFQLITNLCMDDLRKMPEKEKDFWEEILSKMNPKESKAINWAGLDKKTMDVQIRKIAKRLNIPIVK